MIISFFSISSLTYNTFYLLLVLSSYFYVFLTSISFTHLSGYNFVLVLTVVGMRLAIHAPHLGLNLPDQPFGKDVANRGLFNALASMDLSILHFAQRDQLSPAHLQSAFGSSPVAAPLSIAPLLQTSSALNAGTLLRGQPYLSELAWERAHRHGHHAFSLVGLIPWPPQSS